jgi:hypothetical protein
VLLVSSDSVRNFIEALLNAVGKESPVRPDLLARFKELNILLNHPILVFLKRVKETVHLLANKAIVLLHFGVTGFQGFFQLNIEHSVVSGERLMAPLELCFQVVLSLLGLDQQFLGCTKLLLDLVLQHVKFKVQSVLSVHVLLVVQSKLLVQSFDSFDLL